MQRSRHRARSSETSPDCAAALAGRSRRGLGLCLRGDLLREAPVVTCLTATRRCYRSCVAVLDTPYRINHRIVSSIKSADTLAVFGAGAPLELPLALFQVLMAFAGSMTPRQAFQTLDLDVDIDQFGRIVSELLERGLLKREPVDDGRGLQEAINPRIFASSTLVDRIGGWLRQGRAIVIPDALPADFAEEVHRDLDRSEHWRIAEGGHDFFHYRNSVIDELEDLSPALTRCSELFKSARTRRFIGELSGRDCTGEARAAAAWYRPNEYALVHNDLTANSLRSVAYIWYLTKAWRQDWGGSLFWCPTGQYINPGYNILLIFAVTPSNMHLICPVAPTATAKRLTINGFWQRSELPTPSSPISPDAVISPRAYGPPPPEDSDLHPIMVL
jgi:Rps23 Pro-64 3,4-dihydroxylase Tpa1-like proline 4-hydroxylase